MNRRNFIKTSALATGAFALPFNFGCSQNKQKNLYQISENLLRKWNKGLFDLQVKSGENEGAVKCPSCPFFHGRIGDAIYPFLYLAKKDNNSDYLDAGLKTFRWTDKYMSNKDGSWRNDFINSWRGITVFASISAVESLIYCGDILDKKDYDSIRARLRKAAEFIHDYFVIGKTNINYTATAGYAIWLLGKFFDEKKYREKGQLLIGDTLKSFSANDKLLFGEGRPVDIISPKGCRLVDLGYNVEESLPALIHYAVESGDKEALEMAATSMKSHIEFMLPDGAWDNSWGTRNFKWTYWGSRTSDGCQTAMLLLADKDPVFYKAALKNAELFELCTPDNLLYGGLHYASHKIPPCIHHTFAHAKVVANVLQHKKPIPANADSVKLPREEKYGLKHFKDIDTVLISKGAYRATVTALDLDYQDNPRYKNGHASAGSLTLLWHEKAGAIIAGSMNEYQIWEKQNMQYYPDRIPTCATPSIEVVENGVRYANVSDLSGKMTHSVLGDKIVVSAESKLAERDQKSPSGKTKCFAKYEFAENGIDLEYSCENPSARITLPIIARADEKLEMVDAKTAIIRKENCSIKVSADKKLDILPIGKDREFHFCPGFEFVPFVINSTSAKIKIEVI